MHPNRSVLRTSVLLALCLVTAVGAAADGDAAVGQAPTSRLEVVFTGGTGGFSSSISEIKGPRSLRVSDQEASVPGLPPVEAIVPQSYDAAFYRNDDYILFRETSWSVVDLERFLTAGPRLDRVVCRQLWLVESDSELSFEFDPVRCGGLRASSIDALAHAEALPPRQQIAALATRGSGEIVRPVIEDRALSDARWTTGRLLRLKTDDGQTAYLVDVSAAPPKAGELVLDRRAEVWERRFAERARIRMEDEWHRLFSMAKPWNEGSRRAELLRSLDTEAEHGSIWVDGGDLVEEVQSAATAEETELRRLSWRVASSRGLAALVPGYSELSAGLAELTAEAERAGVALLSANLVRDDEPVFAPYRVIERGSRRVAIIGVTAPSVALTLGPEPLEGAQLTDPHAAARDALDEVQRLPRSVDLVVVLFNGHGTPPWLSELRGVDLVFVSDDRAQHDSGWPIRIQAPGDESEAPRARGRRRPPLLVRALSPYGPDIVRAAFRGDDGHDDLDEIQIVPTPVPAGAARDDDIVEQLFNARRGGQHLEDIAVLPDLDPILRKDPELWALLLADPTYAHLSDSERQGGEFPAILTPPVWSQLVAGSVRRALDADVVLIEPPRLRQVGIGPVPRSFCVENLSPSGSLVRVDLPCDQAKSLAAGNPLLPELATAIVTGFDDEEWCRVAMTDTLWQRPVIQELAARHGIDGDAVSRQFRQIEGATVRFEASAHREPLLLRDAVMTVLDDRRVRYDGLGPASEPEVALDMHELVPAAPRWFVDIRELSVGFESLHEPSEDARYSLRFPDGQRIESRGRVRQDYRAEVDVARETDRLHWRFGTQVAYSRDDLGDDEQELRDLVRGNIELSFPGLSRPIGRGFSITPTLLGSIDTELTRPRADDGAREDRLLLVRWTGGMQLKRGRSRLARFGVFGEYDLRDERLEAGLRASADRTFKLGRRLTWENQFDWAYYFPTDRDTERDLGMSANLRTTLSVPLIRQLSFLAYADLLAYRGKVDATSTTGVSTIIGFGVGYQRLRWKPGREALVH